MTQEILKLGLTGRNINPQGVSVLPPLRPGLPGAEQVASGPTINGGVVTVASSHNCQDPSPNAVIRLARVRDNPSFSPVLCLVNNPPNTTTYGSDFWPNALYDTREGLARDNTLAGNQIVLSGVMNYVELDVNNLARWFAGRNRCQRSQRDKSQRLHGLFLRPARRSSRHYRGRTADIGGWQRVEQNGSLRLRGFRRSGFGLCVPEYHAGSGRRRRRRLHFRNGFHADTANVRWNSGVSKSHGGLAHYRFGGDPYFRNCGAKQKPELPHVCALAGICL